MPQTSIATVPQQSSPVTGASAGSETQLAQIPATDKQRQFLQNLSSNCMHAKKLSVNDLAELTKRKARSVIDFYLFVQHAEMSGYSPIDIAKEYGLTP